MVCRRTARGWGCEKRPTIYGPSHAGRGIPALKPNAHSARLRAPPRERGHALNPKP